MVKNIDRFVSVEKTEDGFKVVNTIEEHYDPDDFKQVYDTMVFAKHNKEVELSRYKASIEELEKIKDDLKKDKK